MLPLLQDLLGAGATLGAFTHPFSCGRHHHPVREASAFPSVQIRSREKFVNLAKVSVMKWTNRTPDSEHAPFLIRQWCLESAFALLLVPQN